MVSQAETHTSSGLGVLLDRGRLDLLISFRNSRYAELGIMDIFCSIFPDNAEHREAIVPKWNESPLFLFLYSALSEPLKGRQNLSAGRIELYPSFEL